MKGFLKKRLKAFSLVELVVVIVIIGILAAMAIPRLSRGSAGAGSASAQHNLGVVRNALNLYFTEHNNKYPSGTAANIADQLTKFTDVAGAVSATKTGNYIYGPYLQGVPTCPVGDNAGSKTILVDTTNSPPTVVTTGGEGWVYNPNTGEWLINSTKTDDTGKAFNTY
jgi:prepilin-type N-terminal cleavage/methylation domain-containing protein